MNYIRVFELMELVEEYIDQKIKYAQESSRDTHGLITSDNPVVDAKFKLMSYIEDNF